MKRGLGCAVLFSAIALLPLEAFAQGADVGISGVGLVAIQPVDNYYIGGPYLDKGLGGFAPGVGGGVSVMTPAGFVVVGELNTASFALEQEGRLVSGCTGTTPCVSHTTRWLTSMLTGLVGYAASAGATRVLLLGGVSKNFGAPTLDGEERDTSQDDTGKVVLTGGLDVVRTLTARGALLFSGRYSYVERDSLKFLGAGPHVFRIGVGLRWRIN